MPVLVVGRGSNLLVADAGFAGVAVVLGDDFERVDIDAAGRVPCARAARRRCRCSPAAPRRPASSGLEFYVGIPGSVGGAVRMNAGGHGRETREVLVDVDLLDLRAGDAHDRAPRPTSTSATGTRISTITTSCAAARFAGSPRRAEACAARIDAIVQWRREHQPGGANAGSVFSNPPGDSAGRLIDAAGLKGLRVGGAVVSEKHANFIVADPTATAADVYGAPRRRAPPGGRRHRRRARDRGAARRLRRDASRFRRTRPTRRFGGDRCNRPMSASRPTSIATIEAADDRRRRR